MANATGCLKAACFSHKADESKTLGIEIADFTVSVKIKDG